MSSTEIAQGRGQIVELLDPASSGATERLQTSIVSGHKADFGLMLLDPDPLKIDAVHQRLVASALGPALQATYSFVSLTEISEYVPTLQQYAQRLVSEGETEGTPAFQAKIEAYENREPMMRRDCLTPDSPVWLVTCCYPMYKKRLSGNS